MEIPVPVGRGLAVPVGVALALIVGRLEMRPDPPAVVDDTRRTPTLSGTVVDERGEPVGGIVVSGTLVSAISPQVFQMMDIGSTAITDARGRFSFDHVRPGRYRTTAVGPHGYGLSDGSANVSTGGHTEITVRVYPAHQVAGTIVMPDGTACPTGHLWLRDSLHDRLVEGVPAPDGTIHAGGVLPGTYVPTVTCDDEVAPYDPIVVADRDVTGLRWRVTRTSVTPAPIEVAAGPVGILWSADGEQVIDEPPAPIGTGAVEVLVPAGVDELTLRVVDRVAQRPVREDKFYRPSRIERLCDLPAGSYTIEMSTSTSQGEVDVELDTHTEVMAAISLAKHVTLVGRAVRIGTHEPITGLEMYLSQNDSAFWSAREDSGATINDATTANVTDANGRFELRDVPQAHLLISAMWGAGEARASLLLAQRVSLPSDPPDVIDIGEIAVDVTAVYR